MNTRQSLRLMAAAAAATSGQNGEISDTEPGMRIGEDYQAIVPELVVAEDGKLQIPSLLLWKPAGPSISDHDLDDFLQQAESIYGYTIEQALGMLYWHNWDIGKALNDMPNFKPFKEEWSMEEKVVFERAFHMHGKNFHRIKSFLPNKSINSLVKHYYTQWKRSYLQVSLLDVLAQERQKKEMNGHMSSTGTETNNVLDSSSANMAASQSDVLPASNLKGKQLPRGIFLSVNDFISAFDDPQNKKVKRLEMQILEYKQQIQQNKQLLDTNFEEIGAQEEMEQCRTPTSLVL